MKSEPIIWVCCLLVLAGIIFHFLTKLAELETQGKIITPWGYWTQHPYTSLLVVMAAFLTMGAQYAIGELSYSAALLTGIACNSLGDKLRAQANAKLDKQMMPGAGGAAAVLLAFCLVFAPHASYAAEQSCRPSPWDKTSTPMYTATDNEVDTGFAVVWYCRVGFGWGRAGFSGRKSQLDVTWAAQALAATVSKTAFDALRRRASTQQDDPGLRALYATLAATTNPQSPLYKVAPNGTSSTRPTFQVVAGVRRTVSNGRVAVGTKCGCKLTSVGNYCTAAGLALDTVTLCEGP